MNKYATKTHYPLRALQINVLAKKYYDNPQILFLSDHQPFSKLIMPVFSLAGAAGAMPRLQTFGPGPGGASAPAEIFGPGPGGAIAPATNSGPGPGGAIAPGNFFGPGPGGAMAPPWPAPALPGRRRGRPRAPADTALNTTTAT